MPTVGVDCGQIGGGTHSSHEAEEEDAQVADEGRHDARQHGPALLPRHVQLRRRTVIHARVVEDARAGGEWNLHDVLERALTCDAEQVNTGAPLPTTM